MCLHARHEPEILECKLVILHVVFVLNARTINFKTQAIAARDGAGQLPVPFLGSLLEVAVLGASSFGLEHLMKSKLMG